MRIFYAICDKTVSICDLITPKAEKLTIFRHFRLEVSVCSARAVGASENFWHFTGEQHVASLKKGFLLPKPGGPKDTSAPPPTFKSFPTCNFLMVGMHPHAGKL